MTTEQIIALVMPVLGAGMAIGVVYWQSWRDGVLPSQRPHDKK
ncbi:hypothetical protein [Neorhizobium alkalisoli]|uniref:Uncharacterized protein n=1 Tax=Neorhizobium alkalisoli TaxID=528178 RepID=A0A561QWR5_9HYPH|nr:hypothetical protein [Neorhizobium alkalisoli]TWF54759.1 hypothetical protein FHW37_103629 [Neorhizobium alkalisoli]